MFCGDCGPELPNPGGGRVLKICPQCGRKTRTENTNVASHVVRLAVVYLCCLYGGGFSWRQSILLTLVGFGLIIVYQKFEAFRQTETRFEPFYVSIDAKWHELLPDLGIVKMGLKRQGNKFVSGDGHERAVTVGEAGWSIWHAVVTDLEKRFGSYFTKVSDSPSLKPCNSILSYPPGLFYLHEEASFGTKLKLSDPIAVAKMHDIVQDMEGNFSPRRKDPFFENECWLSGNERSHVLHDNRKTKSVRWSPLSIN
jgi:hypothetical protein